MRTFENPANGYQESVSGLAILWAFLFGIFYFAFKGAWRHAVLSFLVALVAGAFTFGVGSFVVWVAWALFAPVIVANTYLRKGWREVTVGQEGTPRTALTAAAEPAYKSSAARSFTSMPTPAGLKAGAAERPNGQTDTDFGDVTLDGTTKPETVARQQRERLRQARDQHE